MFNLLAVQFNLKLSLDWTVVVNDPEGERYHTEGGRTDADKAELVIDL
jgi:hypothetical protein